MNDDWKLEFHNVWERGVVAWKAGRRSANEMFAPAEVAFLASIGCTAQELFPLVTKLPFRHAFVSETPFQPLQMPRITP